MSVNAKKRKPKKIIVSVITLGLFAASIYLILGVIEEAQTTMKLNQELEEVNAELIKLNEENAVLESQRDKLNNPNYVQSYARGSYMLSKEGEMIFFLPGTTPESEE